MPEGKSDQQSVGHSLLGDASAPVLLLQEEYEELRGTILPSKPSKRSALALDSFHLTLCSLDSWLT